MRYLPYDSREVELTVPKERADGLGIRFSVVVPVYGNAATLPEVIDRLSDMARRLPGALEAVFVVDGSPDDSLALLRKLLPDAGLHAQLLVHSRNFGSFAAIRTGMAASRGEFVAAMAADLQEPPELVEKFFELLVTGDYDVCVGVRSGRADPVLSGAQARVFWALYRRWVHRDIPAGGVDIFACNRLVASRLKEMAESHSSLVGLLYWLGFRRVEVPYERLARTEGKSGWSTRRKVRYLLDSVFSFTDLPISVLVGVGAIGVILSTLASMVTVVARIAGLIRVPGYTALMLVLLLSATSILLGLGIVGSYVWRTYENSKQRPLSVVMIHETVDP
ncbi:MAG: glycosyltransferase [Frankiales bacterium]|nr:glycosyltransferase [Frankiales bacterium]